MPIPVNNLNAQRKFINGTQKVFSKLMANDILYYSLSDETAKSNVYDESFIRGYRDPVYLTGRMINQDTDSPTPVKAQKEMAEFIFPYKTFLLNKIDISLENLDTVKQGIVEYVDAKYEIRYIKPTTFVTGVFLFYKFECVGVGYGA
jgi:hypothetical protein